ncbi:hypothetical protein BGX27_009052 [Mortierella sp. AM989]|nr:hypothetical protein BGX27_009052 [Mortierella sp. AM989]
MAESETLHVKPNQQESITVSLSEIRSDAEYPNPFQHQPSQPQRHYNVMIPAVEQWPELLINGLKTSTKYAIRTLRAISEGIRDGAGSHHYQGLPTNASGSTPFHNLGSKRYSKKAGGASSCTGRRITRILYLLVLVAVVLTWIIIPNTLRPFQDRDIWIRYLTHEESIKITLPYSRIVHVHDVKKVAIKELELGFTGFHTIGNIKLLSDSGWLRPDREWVNTDWAFKSSSHRPILAVDMGRELFMFLNETLGCFSERPLYGVNDFKFVPENLDYSQLASILYHRSTLGDTFYLSNDDIMYLRRGFKG